MKKFASSLVTPISVSLLVLSFLMINTNALTYSSAYPQGIWSHYKGEASAKGYFSVSVNNNPTYTWTVNQGSNAHGNGVVVEQAVGSTPKYILVMPDEVRVVSTGCPGHEYGQLHAYDYLTGAVVWEKGSCSDYVGMFTGQESLAAGFGKVFVTDEGFTSADYAQLHAINPATGQLYWTRNDLGYHTESSPIVGSSYIYIGAGGTVYALHPSNGQTMWSRPLTSSSINQEMALSGSSLYVMAYQNGYGERLYKINANTGVIEWSTTSLGSNANVSFPTITSQGVVVGSDHTFYHFSSTGATLWTRPVEGSVYGSSALLSRTFNSIVVTWAHYPSPLDVRASVLNLTTGAEVRTFSIETYGNQSASPLVAGDKVIFSTYFGHVKIFNVNTGSLIWDSGQFDPGGAGVTPILVADRLTVVGKNGIIKQWNIYTPPAVE